MLFYTLIVLQLIHVSSQLRCPSPKNYNKEDYIKSLHNNDQVGNGTTEILRKFQELIIKPTSSKMVVTNFYDSLTAVYNILLSDVKKIGLYFESYITDYINKKTVSNTLAISLEEIENTLKTMFGKLCEHVPLILYYFINNNVCNTDLFDFYLVYCTDWIDFLNYRCATTSSRGPAYELKCFADFVKKMLSWNTDKILTDKRPKGKAQIKTRIYKESLLINLKNVYDTVDEYYDKSDDSIFLWTTADWMTGRYFITKTYSKDMDGLKNQIIRLHKSNLTLSVAYYKLLPRNLNLKQISVFQNNVLYNVNVATDAYVYRQAIVIILFYEHVNNRVNDVGFEYLRTVFNWYKYGIKIVNHYLSMSGTYEPSQQIYEIVNEISNLKTVDKSKLIAKIQQLIPVQMIEGLTDWASRKLPDTSGIKNISIDYIRVLREMVNKNCENAINFINTFISIANKSMGRKSSLQNTNLLYCLEFSTDIFLESHIDTSMNELYEN